MLYTHTITWVLVVQLAPSPHWTNVYLSPFSVTSCLRRRTASTVWTEWKAPWRPSSLLLSSQTSWRSCMVKWWGWTPSSYCLWSVDFACKPCILKVDGVPTQLFVCECDGKASKVFSQPLCFAAVQDGALRWLQVRLHWPDQKLPGRVRGGEEDQPLCCGGVYESVGGSAIGKLFNNIFKNVVFQHACIVY